jgi:hypothetical protein
MRPWIGAAALLVAATCGRPGAEDELNGEFTGWVAKNNTCATNADCALLNLGCPLECWVAVREDRRDEAAARARSLTEEYMRGGAPCLRRCVTGQIAACVSGRCAVRPAPTGDGGTAP